MSVAEKDVQNPVRSVTISVRRELNRRAEIVAIRRDILALTDEKRKFDEKLQDKMLRLSQRLYELMND